MRKLLVALVAVLVLLVGTILLVPFLVPTATYKEQIAQQVEAATGRQLAIDGELRLALLPRLGLRADGVRFANAEGGVAPAMAEIDQVDIVLATWPLVQGVAEVERLVLRRPVINLEIDAQGRPNWEFGEEAAAAPPAGPPAPATGRGLPLRDLRLGEVRIEDGTIVYRDLRSGESEVIEKADLAVELDDLQSPLAATGALRWRNEPIELTLALERPLALLDGGASDLRLGLRGPASEASFTGTATPLDGAADGALALEAGDLRALARWLGVGEPEGEGLRAAALAGTLALGADAVALRDLRLRLDEIEATGELALALAGPQPAVRGTLAFGHVDLAPYLAPDDAAAADGAGTDGGKPSGWSEEPIALPLPLGLDLDLDVTLAGIGMRDLEIGPSALRARADASGLHLQLARLELYGGSAEGELRLWLEDGVPVIDQRLRLAGVAARPLLRALAEVDRIEGTAEGETALRARGHSERELVESLTGDGRLVVHDGAILGVNLAAMARNVASAFLGQGDGEARRTDFAELGGSFTVEGGLLRNDDLRMVAPLLRLAGAGTVDLPRRSIPGYRLEPRAVASLEGQGAAEDGGGVLVPLEVSGPWDDLTFQADLRGLATPEAIGRQLEQLREGARGQGAEDAVRDVLEGLGGMFRRRP